MRTGQIFARQVVALFKKNLKLQFRNKATTATQLLIGVFFLFLLMVMHFAVKQASERDEQFVQTLDPKVVDASAFEPCMNAAGSPACFDFVYGTMKTVADSGVNDTLAELEGIVLELIQSNADRVRRFENKTEMDAWLRMNPNRTKASFYFENPEEWITDTDKDFAYVLRVNTTKTCKALGIWGCDDPLASVGIPLQTALDGAFATVFNTKYSTNETRKISVKFSDFPHPDLPNYFDVVEFYGPSFLYIAASFNYVIQMSLIVEEKELHLVDALKQMGMTASAYWFSWFLNNMLINTLMVSTMMLFGVIFQLDLFTETAGGLLYSFLWLSAMAFTSMAFLFSALTHSASTARLIGIAVFIVTFLASPILAQLVLSDGSEDMDSARNFMSLFPIFSFHHVLSILIAESSGESKDGMTWDDRVKNILPSDSDNLNGDSFWSVESSLHSLLKGFLLMSFLAWYLEHVIPNEHGHRESIIFFLRPSFWFPNVQSKKKGAKVTDTHAAIYNQGKKGGSQSSNVVSPEDEITDPEVLAEAEAVRRNEFGSRDIAIKLLRLSKHYRGGLCKKPFKAVKGVEYAIDNKSCLCLLGSNGAGKTTTIKMLTGLTDVSDGDATIFGHSVAQEIETIRGLMGVCPQHDILWDQLTGREHLRLFATIKGVPEDKIEEEIKTRLEQTSLTEAGDVASRNYSGGMKRRLSIAIALIGDPKFVVLDEPTTGMDPENRRGVWNMIAKAKAGRVILLTTHSMEEADILGDKICVMSHGKIQALGTSLQLKQRYGSGYRMTMMLKEACTERREKVIEFVSANAPEGTFVSNSDLAGFITLQLPRVENKQLLIDFFKKVEESKTDLLLKDFSLSLSTLEEVFLKLSEKENPQILATIKDNEDKDAQAKPQTEFVERDMGFKTQFSALFNKSWAYQLTQRKTCCGIICFPLVIMSLLILVETAVFNRLRLEIMCGPGIQTKEECLERGYDLQCIEGLYSQLSFASYPTATVGKIQLSGRRGGINANCGKNGCYDDLERPDFSNIPLFTDSASIKQALGSITYQTSGGGDLDRLKNWQANLMFLIANSTGCDAAYDLNFDDTVGCEGLQGSDVSDCQAKLRNYRTAEAYLDSNNGTNVRSEDITSFCLVSSGGSSSSTPVDASTITINKPPQEDLAQVMEWQQVRDECSQQVHAKIWEHFLPDSDDGWDIAVGLQLVNQTIEPGFLGSYSSAYFTEPPLKTWVGSVVSLAFRMPGGIDRRRLISIPQDQTLQDVCANAVLKGFLGSMVLDSIGNANKTATVISNLCAFANNIDIIRAVSFDMSFATLPDMKQSIFNRWLGEQYQTQLMKNHAEDLPLEKRHLSNSYFAHWKALHFSKADPNDIEYTGFYNNSGTGGRQNGNWHSLVWAMDSSIVRSVTGRGVGMKTESMPTQFKCNRDAYLKGENASLECDLLPFFLQISILDFIATSLFPYLLVMHMFIVVNLIVYEKENRLRMIMKMMGLSMRVYWLVNFIFYYVQYLLTIAMMWMMGITAGLQFFKLHDSGMIALFLASWGVLLIIFSFVVSVFFKSSKTCTAGVYLFILVLNTTGTQLIEQLTQDPNSTESSFTALMCIPPMVMIRVVFWLGVAGARKEQITLQNMGTYGNGVISHLITTMWVQVILCSILLWYLDNVLAVGYGVPKHPLFFLSKDYWFPSDENRQTNELKDISLPPGVNEKDFPPDIQKEYERVVNAESDKTPLFSIVRLHKRFKDKVAVKSISLGVNKNECFGLLGHNGAGKTTLLSMLAGLFPPSAGDAVLDNKYSILTDLGKIHQRMGVCPQHDIIWNTLSGRKHLEFYGRLKGLKGKELTAAVNKALADVNLTYAANRAAGTYSGGMKRRLSTAISLMGDPKVIFLDEPSTGLDPFSKKQLLSVIKNAKGNKSIILTTHSMEEADALSDRVGIMSTGLLQCIGPPAELKRRFGKGYTCSITTKDKTPEAHERILKFIQGLYPNATLRNEQLNGTSNFEIPKDDLVISQAFEAIEKAKDEQSIVVWGLSETTLEEVFLAVHKLSHQNRRVSALGFEK